MKNKFAKVLMLLTVVVAMVAMLAVPAMATGETVSVTGVSGVSVSVDSNGTATESSGTVTATATGSVVSRKEATITVKNTSGTTATISFDYTVTTAYTHTFPADNGTYSKVMTADETVSFTVTSNKGLSNRTATVTMSNFSVVTAAASSNVTIVYDSALGSVTAAGSAVADGAVVEGVSLTDGIAMVATPSSGTTFLGWINADTGAVLSSANSFTLTPSADVTVKPVFINSSSNAWFWVNGTSYLFDDLNKASDCATTAVSKTVTLANDGTLPAGDYTVDAGVTLLIPYDSANTLYTTEPGYTTTTGTLNSKTGSYESPTVYRTLTMASGANITVNGALSVGGRQSPQYSYNGMPSGAYGLIKMNSGSVISVESDANLYVWGYITGSGSVEVKDGGSVYEDFQVADYRGGDATSAMASNDNGVFPMSQYYIQNVEVPMKLYAGSNEYAHMSVSVTLIGVKGTNVPFVGDSGAMFKISSGYVVKDYLEGQGRMQVTSYGDITVSSISISLNVTGTGNTTIDSSEFNLPISNHMTIDAASGTVSLNQDLVLYPGSELYIREGVTCNFAAGTRVIVFDLDQWGGYCGAANAQYVALQYVPGGDNKDTRLRDALVQIDGTVNAQSGTIYTTAGGANVISTGTGVVNLVAGTETTAYYAYQYVENNSQKVEYKEYAIQPALLKNEDGSTVDTAAVSGIYTYYAETGRWDSPNHFYENVVTVAPTCTETGTSADVCQVCGDTQNASIVAATGHTEVVDAAVAATCTSAGLTEGKHCSVCGEVTVAQEDIAPLSHTEVIDTAVDATCTESGLTQGTHCSVCGEIMTQQEVIPALGHTEEIDAAVAATCTETGLTEGKHCSACGEVILAQEETPALGHTEVTDKAVAATCTATGLTEGKHCSVCGTVTVAQEVVSALGHSYETVTTDPTYTEAGSKIHTCSNCGDVVTEEIAKLANPVTQYNVSLKENIGVNFVMNLAETDVVTVNGVEVTAVDGVVSIDLAAAQMCDEITITVNGLHLEKTYSVKEYADAILADSSLSEYHNLVKAMLVYGAASQNYFGYNTDNLASADVSTAVVPETTTDIALSDNIDGLDFYGASLSYRNKIAVRFYFTADLSGYTVNVDGYTYTTGENYVEIAGILPQDLGNQITVTVTDAAGNVISVSYGPMNYIVRMNAKGSETAKALVQALYGYSMAAKEVTA